MRSMVEGAAPSAVPVAALSTAAIATGEEPGGVHAPDRLPLVRSAA
jgi:hypothetical protein